MAKGVFRLDRPLDRQLDRLLKESMVQTEKMLHLPVARFRSLGQRPGKHGD